MLSRAILEELKQYIEDHQVQITMNVQLQEADAMSRATVLEKDSELDTFIKGRKKPGFTKTLLQMIDAQSCKDSEIYTKAGLDRRHFSKIRSNPDYQPSKNTAIALALALELDHNDTETLLASAGYTLSESETFDLIITWCIEKGIYDLTEVNQALDYFSQKTIGTIA
ncbi:MAG: hypothetical protein FH749_15860 [Firmicutes bacterium]|nr:hypothetical protein [Bacillota bacterium]